MQMNIETKILYIGSLNKRSNSYRRFATLSTLCKVDAVDTDPYILIKLFSGFQHHLNIGPGVWALNKKIRQSINEKKYDVLLVDNKPYLLKKTLHHIKKKSPSTKIVNLLTDDPFGRYAKSWRLLRETTHLYDLFFVQRKINIAELKKLGAQKVSVCYRSFDPQYNKPYVFQEKEYLQYATPVGFIGTFEEDRASYIAYLIQQGIPVTVTGNDFEGAPYWDIIQPYYQGPSVYGDEYIKKLCGMDIALHFLRHGNRDEQDSRTFEIPASKVFMLAERSELHSAFFKEDKEAVYFSDKEELLQKLKYYLAHPLERLEIANAGFEKCYTGKYSHADRMKQVLIEINEL